VEDPDGNVLMVFQPDAATRGLGGIEELAFINVVAGDLAPARRFWEALGLVAGDAMEQAGWQELRTPEPGAALGVFEPLAERYEAPEGYAADLDHVGEDTGICFETGDLAALAEALRRAGGTMDRSRQGFQDPEGNRFHLTRGPAARRPARRATSKGPRRRRP